MATPTASRDARSGKYIIYSSRSVKSVKPRHRSIADQKYTVHSANELPLRNSSSSRHVALHVQVVECSHHQAEVPTHARRPYLKGKSKLVVQGTARNTVHCENCIVTMSFLAVARSSGACVQGNIIASRHEQTLRAEFHRGRGMAI